MLRAVLEYPLNPELGVRAYLGSYPLGVVYVFVSSIDSYK